VGVILFDKSLLDSYACVHVWHLEPGGLCPG